MGQWIKTVCFLAVFAFVRSADATNAGPLEDLKNRHVLLSAPRDLKPYLVSQTYIVVSWHPPTVYLKIHDVIDKTLVFKEVPGSYVSENRIAESQPESLTMTSNVTDDTENASNNTSPLTPDTTMAPAPASTETVLKKKCYPLSFFANYTVGLNFTGMEQAGSYHTLAFQDTPESHQRTDVNMDKDHPKMVPFEEGCLDYFVVSWSASSIGESGTKTVPGEVYTTNITNLKPGTEYTVTVSANFVSGDSMPSKSIGLFTKQEGENDTCQCNWNGAVNADTKCTKTRAPYCSCKEGYDGPFCEFCRPGYYRTDLEHPCHPCPCPSFATEVNTCRFVEGFLSCDKCRLGYTGNICHRCADGFYMKMGKCVACFCNGNAQPGVARTCHPLTGQCINCQHNTTGDRCEKCLPGYIGDPMSPERCILGKMTAQQRSSGLSTGVVGALVVVGGLLVVFGLIFVVWYRKYRERKARHHFWTVEMNRGQDDVDFNSVPNEDAHMDEVDDLRFYENGTSGRGNKYTRLA